MIDSFHATYDATLRSWELVQVRDKKDRGEVVEEGRGCYVSARWARERDLDFKDEATVKEIIEEYGGEWRRLLPFVDMALMEPRIGFD